jgi:hypothetical protein
MHAADVHYDLSSTRRQRQLAVYSVDDDVHDTDNLTVYERIQVRRLCGMVCTVIRHVAARSSYLVRVGYVVRRMAAARQAVAVCV